MKKFLTVASASFAAWSLLALSTPVSAQDVKCEFKSFLTSFDCVKNIGVQSGVKETDPVQVVLSILRIALTLVAIIGVIGLIIAGIMYMLALGEPQKAEKAKKAIFYVILGLIIIGASILIVNFIITAFQGRGGQGQQQNEAAGERNAPANQPILPVQEPPGRPGFQNPPNE